MAEQPRIHRRPHLLRFSLRTLLLFTAILAAWLSLQVNKAHKQRAAVEAILDIEGLAAYDYQYDSSGRFVREAELGYPVWLQRLLGEHHFKSVVYVILPDITDEDLHEVAGHLRGLKQLHTLILADDVLTDTGMEVIQDLTGIRKLTVTSRNVTDVGVRQLETLNNLETLNLRGTQLTDQGLRGLTELKNLKELYVDFTLVTDAGMSHIAAMKNLTELSLMDTAVGDKGVSLIAALPALTELNLAGTHITDDSVQHLAKLTQLKQLHVEGKLSGTAARALQHRLPNARISAHPTKSP